jgi:gluconolactonase
LGGDEPADTHVLAADPAWNQPNDICETPSGLIFTTDPDFKTRTKSTVLRVNGDGSVTPVIDDMAIPNGIVSGLDGRTLYVSDSHAKHWRTYPIRPDGSIGPGRVFFDPQTPDRADPDGMTIDARGNLYFSGRGGMWVVRPDGSLLEFVAVPEFVSNLAFGGADGRTLFLTCKGKVYSLAMRVRGGATAGLWEINRGRD